MKFGGTSVGDASSIRRVIEIIRAALHESDVVVVVSAMSGTTNALLEAPARTGAGACNRIAVIYKDLIDRHCAVANALIHSPAARKSINRVLQEILNEGIQLCDGATSVDWMTPRFRDAISSLGERLSAALLAAALAEQGVASEAVESTELIVTDSCYGSAEPQMASTRERSRARLRSLLRRGMIPVVTGFIGATIDGVVTTLGRGGSDYSATILGSVLEASEVIIWTDVDGMMTADPRLVPDACTIPEISYREATELAHFGAKVLHPKTLLPVEQLKIPVWVRNTFTPEQPGTKITTTGLPSNGVRAVSVLRDVALISVTNGADGRQPRNFAGNASVCIDTLFISPSSSENVVHFIVSSADADRKAEALRVEFAGAEDIIRVDSAVALLAVIGSDIRNISEIVARTLTALRRQNVNVIAAAQPSSRFNLSFVVPRNQLKRALTAVHREFRLNTPKIETSHPLPVRSQNDISDPTPL